MSHASKMKDIPDVRIRRTPREEIGITDYWLQPLKGRVVTVSHRESDSLPYICNTCHKNDCPHTKRIAKWREDHPNG